MLRAILFDFNGVLVDDEPIHFELLRRVLREEGLDLDEHDYYDHYLGCNDRSCFEKALRVAGEEPTPDRISRLVARKGAYYLVRVRMQGFPVYPGAVELVRSAADRGLMLGVVSGALRDEVEGALSQLDLRASFKCLVTAEDVVAGKPDPEGFRRGLELLNALPPLPQRLLHPHEVLAIEDTPAGITAAQRLGLSTLGVAHTRDREHLAAADRVVPSLVDLDADQLIQLFAEAI